MSETTDPQHLLDAAIKGNRLALGELLEQFRSQLREKVHAQLQGALQRRVDESDIVQQACVRAVEVFQKQFRGTTIEEFWGWLEQIQQHTFIDLARNHQAQRRDVRRQKSDANADKFAGNVSSPSQKAMRAEKHQRIEAALLQLPELQQKAVRLRHLEGRKIEDVARILGKSPAAAAQVIYRGVAALKRLLESDPL
ncbi:sigma-70 family RNA polymerase sigma factor [Thalassoroseus pseudoceratinae]|uniref:sigma-70 family RNA polymerase sigma factor n=1 Tax=Thalassoroseus pseudoceratinae TaxID=2713176 RepID=UPI001420BEE9|nr:sigma-70 family RNA polymerase sigma factor [Thalassoroseus pseudoceratinae]